MSAQPVTAPGAATAPSVHAAEAQARCVARQPIFDRERRLKGYELLFRSHGGASSAIGGTSPEQMSGSTVVTGVLDIGLDQLTGPVPAWINASREFLVSGVLEVLDAKRVVIEVLETVVPDAEVVAAVQRLRELGYTIALDDFEGGPEWEPLLQMAQIVKLDVMNQTKQQIAPRVFRLKPYRVKLLAERVEDQASFLDCVSLGFEYFQGYHFRKPETLQRKVLPVGMARVARLMSLVNDTRVTDQQLEAELRADPGLSVKLLRIVNNAATGYHSVSSLRHAIQLAGRRTLYHWLALLMVSSVPTKDDAEKEIVLQSLERGRFCELMALGTGRREQADPLFLAGLLANLDQILGVSRDELITQMGLSGEVAAALRGEPGPHTAYLAVATAYAAGDWERVAPSADRLGVEEELPELYGAAGGWAREVLRAA
ncbi:MAG: HDOD domain-containing protein [Gemmatimonadaceae bacterium]|nr:HDOD domain-containing protein [Gemmatimonadaceae bacterium]